MNRRDLHLFFHPVSEEPLLFRVECQTAPILTPSPLPSSFRPPERDALELFASPIAASTLTLGLSPRLEMAVRCYYDSFNEGAQKLASPAELYATWESLTAWIGRLMWDNLFANDDGNPNQVGEVLLDALDASRAAEHPLRLFLHLGNPESASTLARLPWSALLVRWRGDNAYHPLLGRGDVHVLYHWSVEGFTSRPITGAETIRVALTHGGDALMEGSDFRRLFIQFQKDLEELPQVNLVTVDSLHDLLGGETRSTDIDLWVHFGHGNVDSRGTGSLQTSAGHVLRRHLCDSTRDVEAYGLDNFVQHLSPRIAVVLSCLVGAPGPNSAASLVRRVLYYSQYVIGFPVPVLAPLACDFAVNLVRALARGDDLEQAVTSSRLNYGAKARELHRELQTLVAWPTALPSMHVRSDALPLEFDFIGHLEGTLREIEQKAQEVQICLAEEEGLGRLDLLTHFIQPLVQQNPSAWAEVQLRLQLTAERKEVSARPLLILGGAGIGKTTFLHYIFTILRRDYPDGRKLVPILLSFRAIQQSWDRLIEVCSNGRMPDIHEVVADVLFSEKGMGQERDRVNDQLRSLTERSSQVRRLLSKGRLVFLLDGLDEVADLLNPTSLKRWVQFLAPLCRAPGARVVISCRKELANMREIIGAFPSGEELSFLPWTEDLIEQLLDQQPLGAEKKAALKGWAREILSTPLFARLAARALVNPSGDDSFSPAAVLDAVVYGWADREANKAGLRKEDLLELACNAGHFLNSQPGASYPLTLLVRAVESSPRFHQSRDRPSQGLHNLTMHCLLVVHQGQVNFAYELLREFFAARYLADHLKEALPPGNDPFHCMIDYAHGPTPNLIRTVVELIEHRTRESYAQNFQRQLNSGRTDNMTEALNGMAGESLLRYSRELKQQLSGQTAASAEGAAQLARLCRDWILPLCSWLEKEHLLMKEGEHDRVVFSGLYFAGGKSFSALHLSNLEFRNCVFKALTFRSSIFWNVRLIDCEVTLCDFRDNTYLHSPELLQASDKVDQESSRSYMLDLQKSKRVQP
jgi:hypothetical protein